METLEETIRRVKEEGDSPLENSGGFSFGQDTVSNPAVQQAQPQDETAMHRALRELGTPDWLNDNVLEPFLRFGGNLGIGFWDTFARKWMNAPALVSRGLGMASEAMLGGQSMFTDAANWLNDADEAYVKASEEARRGVTGGNPTFWDNVAHGAGTSIGHGIESLALGHLALAKGAAASTANMIRFLTEGMTEAVTEAANTTSELYAQDKNRGDDAFWAGMYSLGANAPLDLLSGYLGGKFSNWAWNNIYPDADDGIKWFARNFLTGYAREGAEELTQEPRQQAVEAAAKNTFNSKDMSIWNYGSNLLTEARHILPYTDKNGNYNSGYFAQVAPETAASTLLTSLLLAPFEISGVTPKQAREALHKARKEQFDKGKATLDSLKSQRDELQTQIYNAYQSYGADIDTDFAATKDVQAMQDKLANLDDEISYVQEQLYKVAPATTQVQDDAGFNFYADNPNATRSNTIRQDNPEQSTQQPQNIPPIVEAGTAQGTSTVANEGDTSADSVRNTWREQMRSLGIVPDEGSDFVFDDNGNIVFDDDNNPIIQPINTQNITQSQTQQQDTAPDLIPDTEEAPSASETMLRDLTLTQENSLDNDEDNLVDDEPDEDLDEDFVSEQYNQALPSGNTQDSSDDGSRNIGTFVFSPGIGSNAKDYSFNVVSVPAKISNLLGDLWRHIKNRKARWTGAGIQIRTKRGKVIASFYPHQNNFHFSADFAGTHSMRWEQKFERDFRANLMSYLVSGGFIDEDGNFKPDGNESFRRRWKARIDSDGSFNAFNHNELQQEDLDTDVAKLSVSYQNGEGREVTTDLSVEIGTFGKNMPEQRQYYGRHLNIRDKQGRLIARYSPRTGTIKFTSNGDAQAMKNAVLDKLKRQAKSILNNAGFLDESGKLIPDDNEDYRENRKAANDIPSSIPTQTAQDTQGFSNTAPLGQQETQQAPSVTPMGQQDTASQPTAQAQGKPKGKKANLADAIGNVGNRVDAALGNDSSSETYHQEAAQEEGQSWFDKAVNLVTGLLGRNNNTAGSTTTDSGNTAASASTPSSSRTSKITYQDKNGNTHSLTITSGEFDDSHHNEKQYFGKYIEYTDENGNVVARYSPYVNFLQIAEGLDDADSARNAIVQDMRQSGLQRLIQFGLADEAGQLVDDGNEDFRHKHRTRLDTNPEDTAIHPDNRKTSTGKRTDNRSFLKRAQDRASERKAFRKVKADIYKKLMKAYRRVVNVNSSEAMKGEAPAHWKQGWRTRHWRPVAKRTAHMAASVINGFAHAYGMSIEEFYKDGMHFRAVFNPDYIDAETGNYSRGFMNFVPAGWIEKTDKETGKKKREYHETSEMVLNITRLADVSTSLHEFAHAFRREMENLITTVDDLPQGMYDDWAAMNRWLGISDIDFSKPKKSWTEDQQKRYNNAQEKWAVGAEQYFAAGKSPSFWLRSMFKKFKTWMSHVYHALTDIRYQGTDGHEHEVEITPEVRKFYDNLFKDISYVPSEKNRQARLALAKDTSRSSQSEEFHNQTANGKDNEQNYPSNRTRLNLPFNPNELKTESGLPIEKAKPNEMIVTPYGSLDLGYIPKHVAEFPSGAIRANVGSVVHAEKEHGSQIRSMGYDNAKELLLDVLNNYSEIRRGTGRALLLSAQGDAKHSAMGVVELVDDNGIYRVKTLRVTRNRYLKNKELLFTRSEPNATDPDSGLTFSSEHTLSQGKSELYARQSSNLDESLGSNGLNVNTHNTKPSRIGRSNDTLVSQDDIERFNQLVMHGTGHILLNNRFGLEFIGTGEGEQMMGWGIYFSQRPEVADYYRNFGKNIALLDINGNPLSLDEDVAFMLSSALSQYSKEELTGNFNAVRDALIEKFEIIKNYYSSWNDKEQTKLHADVVNALKQSASSTTPNGNIYFADIPENDTLLDIEARQQTPKVQKAIKKLISKLSPHISNEALERLNSARSGAEIYDAIEHAVKPLIEKGRIKSKKHGGIITQTDMAASLFLNQVGIPGLRYWDAGSREEKSGTHNFVIWNTDMIKLLGLSADSDEDAKQYFRDTARAKQQSNSETYNQTAGLARTMDDLMLLADAKRQYDAVVSKYKGTGMWLKAPNGKPTNLSEKQWIMVRTPNFKAWFGDWENNPAKASKVLDANGEPLVVYHGTESGGFSIFDTNGTGSYFSSNKDTARAYSWGDENINLYPVFINLRNPYILNADGANWNELHVGENYMDTNTLARSVRNGLIGNGSHDGVIVQNVVDVVSGAEEQYDPDTRKIIILDENEVKEKFIGDDFIVFPPNAVKSATNNNGMFSNAGDIYKQIIGIDGARRLDKLEGVTTRMDNLRIARRMERAGLPVAKIWAATGWMRGTDKKWRHEIPDGKIIRSKLNAKRKFAEEFYNLGQAMINDPNFIPSTDEENRFYELEKLSRFPLSEVFDAPMLFNAYPELRNVTVFIDYYSDAAAAYNSDENAIGISASANNFSNGKELRRTLIHEVQHAIQEIEGFAEGSSPDTEEDAAYKRNLKTFRSLIKKLDESSHDIILDIIRAEEKGDYPKMLGLIHTLSDKELNQYNDVRDAWVKVADRRDYLFSKYMRHSGEVEARNSETRAYWGDKRRRNTPLDASEDVSRDEQIVGRLPRKSTHTTSSETYNQIIGYGAAVRLDQLNGNHNLIDNLRTAQRMERKLNPNWGWDGKRDYSSARKIWNATGWFRGADGQWKYELPYGRIITKTFSDIASKNTSRNNDGSVSFSEIKDIPLSSIFDAPELFRAYDALKNLPVSFVVMDNDLMGYLEQDTGNIFVSNKLLQSPFSVEDVLIHEIQHWIQGVEGFARGGNTNMGWQFKGSPALADNVGIYFNPTSFRSMNAKREAQTILDSVSHQQQQIFRSLFELEEKLFTDNFNKEEHANIMRRLSTKNALKFRTWAKLMRNAKPSFGMMHQAEAYSYFGGEVEARNAAERSKLSNADRMYSFPLDTQDTPSEEQFIFDINTKPFSSRRNSDKVAVDYFRNTMLQKLTGNPDETYNQIIGRKGAMLIDRAIGADWLTYNLELAQQMEERGFKSRTIRRATGWEKGHDGQWRFELSDGKLKTELNLKATVPDFDEKSLLFEDFPFGIETRPFATAKLSDVLDNVDLFAAYPQLRHVRVTFIQDKDFVHNSIHYPSGSSFSDNSITLEGNFHFDGSLLHPDLNENTILSLIHEIQHDIQRIEGFAGGSNEELAINNIKVIRDLNKKIDALEEKLSSLYKEPDWDAINRQGKRNTLFIKTQSDAYYDIEAQTNALEKKRDNLIKQFSRDGTARNLYMRSAGETEARNVMTRHNLSDTQRQNSLLADTEDFKHNELLDDNGEAYNQVANEQQIGADNLEKALQIAQQQLDSVRKQYEGTPQWMKAPNGQPTNLTEKQWLLVRTPNFKQWFGDWEAAHIVKNVRDFLEHSEPVGSISGEEFSKTDTPLVDRVMQYYENTGNTVVHNKELGDVILDRRGIKDSAAHGLGKEKSAAFALVPDVIKKGLVYDRQANWKGRSYDTATLIANVKIGGQDYVCEVIVKQSKNRQGFYLHEVELKDNLDGVFKTALNDGTPSRSRLIISRYEAEANNSSKVVDENGEPLIVTHIVRGKGGFSVFNTNGDFSTDWDGKTKGTGAWFADLKGNENSSLETAGIDNVTEGENIYHVFLNLRNPYVYDAEGKRWQRVGKVWIEDTKTGKSISHNNAGKAFSNLSWAGSFIREHLDPDNLEPDRYIVRHETRFQTSDELVRAVRQGIIGNGDHDGVIIRNLRDMSVWGVDDYVAFNPNAIKSATNNNGMFSQSDEIYKQIGTSRKRDMDALIAKRRPDLSQKQRTNAILEIEKLGELSRQGGHPKVEKIATKWLLDGHIRLPEDNYKILDAIKISEQYHFDPLQYDDPNVILAKYTIKEAKSGRINPDTVPEFSNKVDYGNGITVYTVDDTEEGQAAVRSIIDTHWGEDANPWCLAARDENRDMSQAWEYWDDTYNTVEKRIAFKNGKLLAFCASDDDTNTWWSRKDEPSSGIPYSVKENGSTFDYGYNEETGASTKLSETLPDGTERSYYDNGTLRHEKLPDRTQRGWYENGNIRVEKLPDGKHREWHENGALKHEFLPDGTKHTWYDNGQLEQETLPDGTSTRWWLNGKKQSEFLPGGTFGTYREFYDNGQLHRERLPDGTIHEWFKNGQMSYEKLPDGTVREWFENGNMRKEELPDKKTLRKKTVRKWFENGQMSSEKLSDGTEREWFEDGKPRSEYLTDGTKRSWFRNGNLSEEWLPATRDPHSFRGTLRTWYDSGHIRSVDVSGLSSEVSYTWFDNGQLHLIEDLRKDIYFTWDYDGKLISASKGSGNVALSQNEIDELLENVYHPEAYNQTGNNQQDSNNDAIDYFNNYKREHKDGFIYPDAVERFDQIVTHATGNIIWNNRFDLRYAGSSEGSAAFGFGAYFAQNPAVAETYRHHGLTNYGLGVMNVTFKDGRTLQLHNVKHYIDARYAGITEPDIYSRIIEPFVSTKLFTPETELDFKQAKKQLRKSFKNAIKQTGNAPYYKNLLKQLSQIKDVTFPNPMNGNMYQFDIPEDYELLDWDAPLDEQPDNVQKALRKVFAALNRRGFSREEIIINPEGGAIFGNEHPSPTGGDLYEGIVRAFEYMDKLGEDLFSLKKKGISRPDARASWLLNKYGIPGHRYWDADSRHDKSGTHNFVIWNMDRVTMTGISDDSDELARKTFLNNGKQQLDIPFSESENYNQIIGVDGARKLDIKNGNSFILDSLNIAKAMNKAGLPPLKTRIATGWELGYDGEWKYEIQDGNIDDFQLFAAFQNNSGKLPFSITLNHLYNNQELFRAYPQLRDLAVIFDDNLPDNIGGFFAYPAGGNDFSNSYIAINTSSKSGNSIDSIRSTLIHEIQHAIQFTEGFAEGGQSSDVLVQGDTAMAIAQRHIEARLLQNMQGINANKLRKLAELYSNAKYSQALKLAGTLSGKEKFRWITIKSILDAIRNGQYRFNTYQYMGGEIEARNSQTRRNFSQEQRRRTLLADTQDEDNWLVQKNGVPLNFSIIHDYTNDANSHSFLTQEKYQQLMHHGTRHMLLRNGFDLQYISSGEGSQAYGYGIYLAEAFGTADYYRHAGIPKDGIIFINKKGEEVPERDLKDILITDINIGVLFGTREHIDIDALISEIKSLAPISKPDFKRLRHDIIKKYADNVINSLRNKLYPSHLDLISKYLYNSLGANVPVEISKIEPTNGNHYLVDGPDNDVLLDWDAPMSKQQDKVLQALKHGGLYLNDDETGQQLYYRLAKQLGGWDDGERLASMKLNELGIPGHRFWDAGSRRDKSGTHNFVIWNTDTLRVLGLTDDSEQDAHEYFHAEDYSNAYLDSLDNDSDVLDYSNADFEADMAHIDDLADAHSDALDNLPDSETYSQAKAAYELLTPDAKQQVDALRAKFKGTQQWLKAPNGKKTNLSELQWLLVRTDNFKQWFGDWEHDKENSSKIMDTNGEPLIVYHGTFKSNRFSVFNTQPEGAHFGSRNAALDRIAYSTGFDGRDDKFFNYSSSGKIIPCFLNIRNPMLSSDNSDWKSAIRDAQSRGHDGIIYQNSIEDKGSYSFIIFTPNQTKSASKNNGQYSNNEGDFYRQTASSNDNDIPEAQIKAVRKKYKGTASWMKAPNGKPTNLTQKQWLQVRTPSFKAWFGDWENDADNASKVLDDNGEPLVLYHRTQRGRDFSIFENSSSGIHFGTRQQADDRASGKIFPAFLNIRNPERMHDQGVSWYHPVRWAKDSGYDGIVYLNEVEGVSPGSTPQDSWVVFSPNQIKSATKNNGLFDSNDPDIYHQNATSNDNHQDTYGIDADGRQLLIPFNPPEIEAVWDKFKDTDAIFTAPNGKQSLLPKMQWLLVRTQSFKHWFGDWENDPQHSSKVLDKNGEPMIVYHGTPKGGFSSFKTNGKGKTKGTGAWFTNSKDNARSYTLEWDTGKIYPVFLNLRNPYVVDAKGKNWDSVGNINVKNKRTGRLIKQTFDSIANAQRFVDINMLDPEHELYEVIHDDFMNTDEIARAVRNGRLGNGQHDGVIFRNIHDNARSFDPLSDVFTIFHPVQVKSKDNNGAFSNGSTEIYKQNTNTSQNNNVVRSVDDFLTPEARRQVDAVRKQYQGTSLWMKAPNGKDTNLDELQWLLVRIPNFKAWFGDWENNPQQASKILDQNGEPLIVYHGTGRADRVGSVFRPDRATSGPMAFFTDSREVAENYSHNKKDTSLSRDGYGDYHKMFVVERNLGRGKTQKIYLDDYWLYLPYETRENIAKIAPTICFDYDNNYEIISIPSNKIGTGGYVQHIRQAGGNHLKALIIEWLDSGNLFNQEEKFLDVLKLVGLDNVKYIDPNYREEAIYPVFINMRNPFDTTNISTSDLQAIRRSAIAAERFFDPQKAYLADAWDKSNISPREWLESLDDDIIENTTHAWTSIPDFVTNRLKKLGYDGIKDTGGKYHAVQHTVYIPFKSTQIKSSTRNNGNYKGTNSDIYKQTVSDSSLNSPLARSTEDFVVRHEANIKSATRNNGEYTAHADIYRQAASLHDSPLLERYPQSQTFNNQNAEASYRKSHNPKKQKAEASHGIMHSLKELLKGFRGDFPLLAGNKDFIPAREFLRIMNRNSEAKTHIALRSLYDSLHALNAEQFDIFSRIMLLEDIKNFALANPASREHLPLGYDAKSLVLDYKKFLALAKKDKAIWNAVVAEFNINKNTRQDLVALASKLGFKSLVKRLQANDLFLIQYADLLGHNEINSNYIVAIGDLRATMLQDIERLTALQKIKAKYDKKRELISKFGDNWKLHIPEGYSIFNPMAANFIQSAQSLSDTVLGAAIDEAGKQLALSDKTMDSIRSKVSDKLGTQLMVLPDEITKTLNKLNEKKQRNALTQFVKDITTGWKKYTLYFLTRAAKYNTRNITGDLDAAMAGNPTCIRFLPKAISELWTAYYGDKSKVSQELKEFQARGGALTFEAAQIFGDEKQLKEFNSLIADIDAKGNSAWHNLPRNAWKLIDKFAWSGIQKASDFREQWLRYAAYLDYLNQMQHNNGVPRNFGASVKEEVMAIYDIRDRAFKLANELLGAYDQVSETGKQLRDILMPFYSWIEVNAKRYIQLIKNGLTEDDFLTSKLPKMLAAQIPGLSYKALKTLFLINLFSILVNFFNRFFFTDDEKKLPPDIQGRPHLTLGHDKDGNTLYFSQVGALFDNLEWFGLDTFSHDIKHILNGQLTVTDWLKQIASAPFSKVINALTPLIKTPMELATGRSVYPSISNPRTIRNSLQYFAQSYGLNWPYKALTDEHVNHWHEFRNLFLYSQDADRAASFYIADLADQYNEKVLGKGKNSYAANPILSKLKEAIRFHDNDGVIRSLNEYYAHGGTKQGLSASLRTLDPLHSVKKSSQDDFKKWLSDEDRVFLNRAQKYYDRLMAFYNEATKDYTHPDGKKASPKQRNTSKPQPVQKQKTTKPQPAQRQKQTINLDEELLRRTGL